VMEDPYICLLAQQSSGKIAASAPDNCLHFTAESEGWPSQANHDLHNGLTMDQYLQFNSSLSIDAVNMDCGGSTMTAQYGNLVNSCAAQQRARTRNTHLSDPSGLTMQKVAVVGDGGNGRGSGGSGVAAFGGGVVSDVAPREGTPSACSLMGASEQ